MSGSPHTDFDTRTPFVSHLGIEIVQAEPGKSVCRLEFAEHLRNRRGFVHGGALFSLVDSAMGVAQHLTLNPGETSATLEIQIGYLKPVKDATTTCEARVTKRGNRVIFLEADVFVDSEVVATATGSYAVSQLPA